ncbi:MAG TPA: YCF48-related protein [Bacteroidota bacterium]|nr:YCF48-related protein [Bacteroidota bacterium]
MKSQWYVWLFCLVVLVPSTMFAQHSTVYASVLSTKLFVVGAANPETGLYLQSQPTTDTIWHHVGPKTIRDFGLAVYSPSKGQIICLASGNGVHRTTDGGKTWKITSGWEITEVLCVTIDRNDPNIIYCGTPYGVFRTLDGGTTWVECTNGIKEKFTSSVIIDAANPAVLYCATEGGVYRSDDRGTTWMRTGLSVGGVRVVVQNPKDPTMLVAGTDDYGIYITHNTGRYWEKTEAGLDHQTFYSIAFDPSNPKVLFAGGYVTGVYKSVDGGVSWARKNTGISVLNIHSIAVDPTNSNRVFAGSMWGGLFRSEDGGETWNKAGLTGSQVWQIVVEPY